MHNRSDGLSKDEKAIFKHLEKRLFHERRVVDPSYIGHSNVPKVSSAINFDCLLNINEQICPLFVLEFYKSVWITQNRDQTISIAFIIKNQDIVLPLSNFAEILRVLCEGACMYTVDWSLATLPKSLDSNPTYHTHLDDPGRVKRLMVDEKRPHPPTSSSSSSQSQSQEENDLVDN
ncbi:hypothetical protein Tco_1204325 [Tanacetum coccineum]